MAKAVQSSVAEFNNSQLPFTAHINKKIALTIVGVFVFLLSGYAQGPYYNTVAATDASQLSSWTNNSSGLAGAAPTSFSGGDVFVVRPATTLGSTAPWAVSGTGAQVIIQGTFNPMSTFSLTGTSTTLDIVGTFTPGSTTTIAGDFYNEGTFNANGQEVIFGSTGLIDGTNSTTFHILTIDDVTDGDVSLATITGLVTIDDGGTLNLDNGFLNIGNPGVDDANNTIAFAGAATINAVNGNFANPFDGNSDKIQDPGTMALNGTLPGVKTITVNGDITMYNVTTAGGDGSVDLDLHSQGSGVNMGTIINGTMTITGANSDQFTLTTLSPKWGNTSTLFINNNGQTYVPGGPSRLEWVASNGGVSGTTSGYPNNVTLVNLGTADPVTGTGFNPTGGGGFWSIAGTFTLGSGGIPAKASVENTTFNCGGIVINANSALKGNNINDMGVWARNGSGLALGTYTSDIGGTVTFNGSSSSPSSPQTIQVASGTETSFYNIAVNNNAYVKLLSPVTISTAGTVTMQFGRMETSNTKLLTILNTSTGAFTGHANAYVVGPVKWALAAGSPTLDYDYWIGTSAGFYPFVLDASSAAGTNATVTAFSSASGGTPDGSTVLSQSVTEYWNLTTSSPLTAGSSVGIDRPGGALPYDLIAENAVSKSGIYSSIAGTNTSNPSIVATGYYASNDIGAGSNFFFLFGDDQVVTPVVFESIKATLHNSNQALVQWQVADQTGIVSYIVEKSTNGTNYSSIGSVTATTGGSSLSYSFNDPNLETGHAYYKIASVDQNGDEAYSFIAEVGAAATTDFASVTVYPNPVTGSTIGLLTTNVPGGLYALTLQNGVGQVVYTSELNHAAGSTTESITPNSYLLPGTYYMTLTSAIGTRFVVTVVVIH